VADFCQFVQASVVSLWALASVVSGVLPFLSRTVREKVHHIRSVVVTGTPAVKGDAQSAPTSVGTVLWVALCWVASLVFLWIACFQAWEQQHLELTQIKNDHPKIVLGKANKEEVIVPGPHYWNIDVDAVADGGVIDASPTLLSICQVINAACNQQMSFFQPELLGWRIKELGQPLDLIAKQPRPFVPIIVRQGGKSAYVFFGTRDNTHQPDFGCGFCEDISPGKYELKIQVSGRAPADNRILSSDITVYIFDWTGEIETSNFEPMR
jgi:hypothetical protein